MTKPNPKCYHLSASCISAFKACPVRFRLKYREGLRKIEDTESQRIGTNWHAIHEVYQNALMDMDHEEIGTDEQKQEAAMQAVVDHLNEAYKQRPDGVHVFDWAVERHILYISFLGYLWYFQNDDVEYLHQEMELRLPLHSPGTGMPLPTSEVMRVGKIDHVVRYDGVVGQWERKSTTQDISEDGRYWERVDRNAQVSMYALALNDMMEAVELPFEVGDQDLVGPTIYDVWRRPSIKPKFLSQKDTTAFLESGEYYGVEFDVEVGGSEDDPHIEVDGEAAEVKVGKSGKPAIKETVEMYGVRLLDDIYQRPEHYYQRKPIARTQNQLRDFRKELFRTYQAQRAFERTGCWYKNEQQCEATFKCPYIPICYGPGPDAVCDGQTTPEGFERIFVDLTVEGSEVEDES